MSDVTNAVNDKLIQALQNKIGAPTCPMCQRNQMGVAPQLYTLTHISDDGTAVDFGYTIPLVVTHCKHCGYVMLFSAQTLGL